MLIHHYFSSKQLGRNSLMWMGLSAITTFSISLINISWYRRFLFTISSLALVVSNYSKQTKIIIIPSLYSPKRLDFAHIEDSIVPNCDFRRFRSRWTLDGRDVVLHVLGYFLITIHPCITGKHSHDRVLVVSCRKKSQVLSATIIFICYRDFPQYVTSWYELFLESWHNKEKNPNLCFDLFSEHWLL